MQTVSLLIFTLVSLFVTAQISPTPSDKGEEEEVRKASDQEVQAFLHNDPKTMARLWSEDFVVTNPLNKFVNKQQVLGMVQSGFLVITSYDRSIEYAHVHDDTVILAGSERVVWGGKDAECWQGRPTSIYGDLDETVGSMARGGLSCQYRAAAVAHPIGAQWRSSPACSWRNMYGPPWNCKKNRVRREQSAKMYPAS